MYDGGELGPENDTPLLLGSRRSDLSAQVASQVPLGPEMGQTMGVANKTPVGNTRIPLR